MRKFTHPFDHYELDNHRAIAVELHPQGWKSYGDLYENPIYYFNAFQFIGGDFYRAVLGYEKLWNRDREEDMVRALDFYLDWVCDREEYYFQQIVFKKRTKIFGLPWRRGVKPRVNFRVRHPKLVEAGTKALARVNVLDKPHHVDIEFFGTGEIFTIPLLQYLRWRDSERLQFKDKPVSKRVRKKESYERQTRTTESHRREEPFEALVVKLPGLCPRERGTHSVREARQKAG